MRSIVSHKLRVPVILVSLAVFASMVYSHCQIPCGIYDDPARFVTLAEHIATIEKSVNQINELSQENKPNFNQIVRWVQNKDAHADELSEIVTYYFMAQRVKPVGGSDGPAYQKYIRQLTLLHEMLVYSMKAKQTTDLANVEKLRTLLAEFRAAYLGESGQKR
jgi:nickel superoxide dismutase